MPDAVSETNPLDNVVNKRRRKGVRNPENYKQNIIKKCKLQGTEHINHKGQSIPAKLTGDIFKCRDGCFDKFSNDDKTTILNTINQIETKTLQDLYLQSLIEHHDVQRRRPRNEDAMERGSSFKYYVMQGAERVSVCQKAFITLHCVTEKRIRRLRSLLHEGKTPKELRGKAPRPLFEISSLELASIDEHVRSFPIKTSHYSSREKTYLDARLNVKVMYDMFRIKFPTTSVKYEYFMKYFHENFGYSFGRPQVDTCVTCEELSLKVKSPSLNDVAKRMVAAELLVHKTRAKKFYKKMKEIENLCQKNDKVKALCFDFMQNLPLPAIPVQDIFYLRQLWVFVFGIHDLGSNNAQIFLYHEGQAKKGANDVCSMILKYIEEKIPAETSELHLFSDGCSGQNKNHSMLRILLTLVGQGRFQKIYHYYPERGHSYLQCDRDFALIKKKVRRADRVYVPDEYHQMIISARKDSFDVKLLSTEEVVNVNNWWPNHYKKSCVPMEKLRPGQKRCPGDSLAVMANKMYVYDGATPGVLRAYERIDGPVHRSYRLLKGTVVPSLPTELAYTEQVPINEKKLKDVRKVMQHIPEEHKDFYNTLLQWRSTTDDSVDDN